MKTSSYNIQYLMVLSFIPILHGCTTESLSQTNPLPWEIEEPTSSKQTSPPQKPAKPSLITDTTITFPAGTFSWAKPDHQVILHLPADAARAEEETGCCDDGGTWYGNGSRTARRIGGAWLHNFLLPEKYGSFRTATRKLDEAVHSELSEMESPFLQGVYLPKQLQQDPTPTLHLFTCTRPLRYRVGNIYFSCSNTGGVRSSLEIPNNTKEGEWASCEVFRVRAFYSLDGMSKPEPVPELCKDVMAEKVHEPWEGVTIFTQDLATTPDKMVVPFAAVPEQIAPATNDYPLPPNPTKWTREMPLVMVIEAPFKPSVSATPEE